MCAVSKRPHARPLAHRNRRPELPCDEGVTGKLLIHKWGKNTADFPKKTRVTLGAHNELKNFNPTHLAGFFAW
jgi:hypothetical protein